jgi:hypothetical protein
VVNRRRAGCGVERVAGCVENTRERKSSSARWH